MKIFETYILVIVTLFYFNCIAQKSDSIPANSKMDTTAIYDYKKSHNLSVPIIVSYHVEERINMKFGSSITTYNVSNLSLVNTNDLGPNNTRIITPKFGKAKAQPIEKLNKEQLKFLVDVISSDEKKYKVYVYDPIQKERYIVVNILDTFERVIESGYKTVDMLKRVGDRRYFQGELVIAAKWYTQLFDITNDLESQYYYRYAMSLIAIFEIEKSKEMMKKYNDKSIQK